MKLEKLKNSSILVKILLFFNCAFVQRFLKFTVNLIYNFILIAGTFMNLKLPDCVILHKAKRNYCFFVTVFPNNANYFYFILDIF